MRIARFALLFAALALAACEDPVGTGIDRPIPDRWLSVSAGAEHTCAIASDRSAWCWGRATTARLGFLSQAFPCDSTMCIQPVPVIGDLEFDAISAGSMHTCGLSRDIAYCWGWDWWGQLGDVATTTQTCNDPPGTAELPCSLDPLPAALGFVTTDVSAGVDYTCATTETGTAYCWGIGQHGQLGVGFAKDSLLSPGAVAGDHDFVDVSTGASHACALDDGREIWCWGANPDGRLGSGDFVDSYPPVQVVDDPERAIALQWTTFDVGFIHACGITTSGDGYCWGGGGGRIGDDSPYSWHYPRRVQMPDSTVTLVQITAGGTHSCAITADRDLFCWGENAYGQVGDGSQADQLAPRQVGPAIEWASVDAGTHHTCGIDTAGRLYCWGEGSSGQLGNGELSDRVTPVPIASS